MQQFAITQELEAIEEAVTAASGDARLWPMLVLAWQLRQRDPARARELADTVGLAVSVSNLPEKERRRIAIRLQLVQAEIDWLDAQIEQAMRDAGQSLASASALDDPAACVDACFLTAQMASNRGDHAQRDAALVQALQHARQADDLPRRVVIEATQARYGVFNDVQRSAERWQKRLATLPGNLPPGTQAAVHACTGAHVYLMGDFSAAIRELTQCYHAASDTGQVLLAIVTANNIGEAFSVLNDLDASLEWMQRGLDLARASGWPVGLGPSLLNMGEVMRGVGRLDAAKGFLDEALMVFEPFSQSRNYMALLGALGELSLERGEGTEALHFFRQQNERAQVLAQVDHQIHATLGSARAHMLQQDIEAAYAAALTALHKAQEQNAVARQVGARQLLARIETRRGDPTHALELLQQALATGQGIEGYSAPDDLLADVAAAYAACQRYEEAYRFSLEAGKARQRIHGQEISNRATAMQIKLDTERIHALAEQHRQQALAEANRASLLERTSSMLEHLGAIGQEITAQLDKERAFEAIHRHVHGLLDSPCFAIYLMDADGMGMTSVYDVEAGVRLPSDAIRLDDEHSHCAHCVRERRELLIEFASQAPAPSHIPGTLVTRSALFAPLIIGQRVLGVMTIQSEKIHAYAEQERLIFRTLCAYAAIALDNAMAYAHLTDARDQLVETEKLAALGGLVAGIAHELNTPIGNSLLMATSFQDKTVELVTAVEGQSLRRSQLTSYLDDARNSMSLIVRGLHSAAELVQNFKQVAVDRATEMRRQFDLRQTSEEIIATLQRTIHLAGHRIEIDLPADVVMDSYPGPYGQVLSNLINNALIHAFEGRGQGLMRFTGKRLRSEHVELGFSDDGIGISQENLPRIFDPFFTTKLGRGGSGLGMSISYNIVTSVLGGELTVDSRPGEGTCFTLRLPLCAPAHASDHTG